jgi:hypothetical protein
MENIILIPSTCNMNDPSTPSRFRLFFDAALQDYEKQTGINLADHPFAKQLESCDSVESITTLFQEQAQDFSEFRGNDCRIMRPLKSAVSILYALSTSTVLSEAIGLVRRNALIDIPRPQRFHYSHSHLPKRYLLASPFCSRSVFFSVHTFSVLVTPKPFRRSKTLAQASTLSSICSSALGIFLIAWIFIPRFPLLQQ